MRSAKALFCLTGLLTAIATGVSFGDEIDRLTSTLAEKGIISYGEARQILTEGGDDARQKLAMGESKTLPYWIQNISLKGDLRLRHQVDWDASKKSARARERLRLRLGFDTRVAGSLKAGFGLATGAEIVNGAGTFTDRSVIDAEPSSTNYTFSNGFAKAPLMVDYAFLEYTPYSWAKLTGGKMKSGAGVWNATDLLWDTDINPDGVAVNLSRDVASSLTIFFTGSWLIFNELNAANGATALNSNLPAGTPVENPDAYIAQPGVVWKVNDKVDLKAAVAYQGFNVKNKNLTFYGATQAGSIPTFDYICWNPGFNVNVKELVGALSLSVFGEYVRNYDPAAPSDNTGSSYGVRFGDARISEFGQWQASFSSRRLENNAWLNKLGDSDAYGGAVNSSGYEAAVTVGLTPSATLGIDYYFMDRILGATATTPRSLVQFDVVYKF